MKFTFYKNNNVDQKFTLTKHEFASGFCEWLEVNPDHMMRGWESMIIAYVSFGLNSVFERIPFGEDDLREMTDACKNEMANQWIRDRVNEQINSNPNY